MGGAARKRCELMMERRLRDDAGIQSVRVRKSTELGMCGEFTVHSCMVNHQMGGVAGAA